MESEPSSGSGRDAARQRIRVVLVQSADTIAIESLLLHFQVRADEKVGRQLLDGKADGFRGLGKSPVAHRPVALATARGEQFCRGAVVETVHDELEYTHRTGAPSHFFGEALDQSNNEGEFGA